MIRIFICFASIGILVGCNSTHDDAPAFETALDNAQQSSLPRSVQDRFGTRYLDPSAKYRRAPMLTPISLPKISHSNAIWGATGRDDLGNIYLGVFCNGSDRPSAALCRLSASASIATLLGDANSNLDRLDSSRSKPQQAKIHGKPVQADNGFVYFVSMDEDGEKEDGSALPTWGSHFWRIDPLGDGSYWEHLLKVPEALIATACTGRYVYALGYFDHIVYQFDTETSTTRVKTVGSVGGHISRNFLVDLNEHCYVPRLSRSSDGAIQEAELVELDSNLNEVVAHPLPDYGGTDDSKSHGIVSFVTLKNGDLVFITAKGAIFRIHPNQTVPSTLERIAWIHPDGSSYAAFLVCPDGDSLLCALARRPKSAFQWVTYDLQSKTSTEMELDPDSYSLISRPSTSLYGSNTLDNAGNAFVVGRYTNTQGERTPLAIRVNWQ
ncbi:MAG: hypothetical protein P8L85_03885 [Rubripirellula sp.]|nr:hypothetical protein [Rubripirellula sp.]